MYRVTACIKQTNGQTYLCVPDYLIFVLDCNLLLTMKQIICLNRCDLGANMDAKLKGGQKM